MASDSIHEPDHDPEKANPQGHLDLSPIKVDSDPTTVNTPS